MVNKKRDSFMPYGLLTNKEFDKALRAKIKEQEKKENEKHKGS
jgi:hypothetical protein